MKILIIEDDKRISAPISEDLRNQHYVVDVAEDGQTALSMAKSCEYDLLLLDLMLPRLDGVEVCRTLRANGYAGWVLMLTARAAKDDKILGLDSGADDYLVKPFDIDELNARVRALLRRGTDGLRAQLVHGNLSVDLRACAAHYGGRQVVLTPTEYRLLVTFIRNPGRIFSKNDLIEKLWSDDDVPTDAVIKAHIKGLRHKLAAAGAAQQLIETVYGFGYRLKA